MQCRSEAKAESGRRPDLSEESLASPRAICSPKSSTYSCRVPLGACRRAICFWPPLGSGLRVRGKACASFGRICASRLEEFEGA